jgi:hypothetical protein
LTGTLSGFLVVDNVTPVYSRTPGETVQGGPYTEINGNPPSTTGAVPFTASLSGLTPATKYYFLARSQSNNGRVAGAELYFITLEGPTPTVAAMYPDKGMQGTSLPATIIGDNFSGANAIIFSRGGVIDNKIAAGSLVVNNNNQITANVTITADASVGARDVTVITSQGGASAPLIGGFIVSSSQMPAINNISPATGKPGEMLTAVQILGNYLTAPTSINFGSGIIAHNVVEVNDSQITVTLAIDAGALPGARDVSVTTLAGTATRTGGLRVLELTITSVILILKSRRRSS